MIKKIFISVIAFLMMLFPNSGNLLITYQQLSFPGEKQAAQSIIDAIVDSDIETIKEMYSETAKSTGEVTTKSIEMLIDSFDGEILYGDYVQCDSSDYINNGKGKCTRQLKVDIVTAKEKYRMYASWCVVDTENPDEVGLMQLTIYPYVWKEPRVPLAQVPLKESLNDERK